MAADRAAAKVESVGTPFQKNAYAAFDNFIPSITKVFNDLGMPIPNVLGALLYPADSVEANVVTYLDFWTAIMEWPVIQYYILFAVSGSIMGTLGMIAFVWKYLNQTGFEGVAWGDAGL